MIRRLSVLFILGSLLLFSSQPVAQERKKKKEEQTAPVIKLVPQIAVDLGKTTKISVRGLNLEQVKDVIVQEPKSSAKVLGPSKKVPVPNQMDVNRVGDTELEIEVTLPEEIAGRTVPITVVYADGESKPHLLAVNDTTPRIAEKESNDGFRTAQTISCPIIVEGVIKQNQDVDVFRIEGKKGERIGVEVQARRFGSPAEPMLTLYNSQGKTLIQADEARPGKDVLMEITLPEDGIFFLSLIDANDLGSPLHIYRLVFHKE